MIAVFAVLFLLAAHFWRLTAVPGMHFDEAFAARLAARIATEPGFWPVEAQSPFTSAWHHWITALGFQIGGVSILTFRVMQMAQVWIGLLAMAWAVGVRWGKTSALWFFPMVALIPALFLNHRFAIELTGFHVLCFGLMSLGIVKRWSVLAVAAAVLGVWSHVLFLAPVLAALAYMEFRQVELSGRERRILVMGWTALLPFFFRVMVQLRHDFRAKVFLILAVSAILFYGLNVSGNPRWRLLVSKAAPWASRAIPVVALVWWVPALIFAEGHWMVLVAKGDWGWGWVIPGLMLPAWWVVGKEIRKFPEFLGLALLTVALGVMIPKPTPRYFELVFLAVAALGGVALGRSRAKHWATVLGLVGVTWMFSAHYQPGVAVERDLKFLFLRDSSTDFLSKQDVATFLGSNGCRASDIRIADYRGGEALRFLDWKTADRPCAWPQAILRRASETSHGGKVVAEVAGFVLEH